MSRSTFEEFAGELAPTGPNGLCQPAEFLLVGRRDEHVQEQPHSQDPRLKADPGLEAEADHVCGTWAVKELDCPTGGMLRVQRKLTDGFAADGTNHRPEPVTFPPPPQVAGWMTQFLRTKLPPDSMSTPVSDCYYPKIPGAADCPLSN